MSGFVEGIDRSQSTFFPPMLDDWQDDPTLLDKRVQGVCVEIKVHTRGHASRLTMGARGRARDCAGTPRSSSGKNDDTSSDSGTSLRHYQVLDGSNALSHEAATESGNRDGAQCARLQHKARDGAHRRSWAAGGLRDLSRRMLRAQIKAGRRPGIVGGGQRVDSAQIGVP
jgi:hypothetical protein